MNSFNIFAFCLIYGLVFLENASAAKNSGVRDKNRPSNSVVRNRRFMCSEKQTINFDKVCDGKHDCHDSSDETPAQCAHIVCPGHLYKCGYGACVSNVAHCDRNNSTVGNGQRNRVKHARATDSSGCTITRIPRDGRIKYHDDTHEDLHINDVVDNFVQIEYSCYDGNMLVGFPLNMCLDGMWINAMPECKTRCSQTEVSSITFVANCYVLKNGVEQQVRCTEPAVPGTIAKINCQRGYEYVRPQQQIISCGNDGRWFPAPIQCTQICGEEGPDGTPYIVGGEIANITKVPWHVGVYRWVQGSFVQQCGGTILNAKVVISAMHCFWDGVNGLPYPAAEYRIAAGKFHRLYDDTTESNKVQVFAIDKIHHVNGYMDYNGLFANDIALLVLNQYIEFKVNIAPICFDYDLTFDEKTVPAGWVGRVAGWGLTQSSGLPSNDLKMIELPVVGREDCIRVVGAPFAPFVTPDKFCAGHLIGVSVCQGDSGGGLVFPKKVNGRTLYYLRGIVSTGPNKGSSCDNDKYTTFTNTAHFADFVFRYEFEHRPSANMMESIDQSTPHNYVACQINRLPTDGFVTPLGDSHNFLAIGHHIDSFGLVQYGCAEHYSLVGNSTNVCVNGTWTEKMPECKRRPINNQNIYYPDDFEATGSGGNCKITKIPRKGWIEYGHHIKLSLDAWVTHQTKIKSRCINNYAIDATESKWSTCINGEWSTRIPDCFAVCSHRDINSLSVKMIDCSLNDTKVDCNKAATQGTIAYVRCRDGYQRSGPKDQVITCGEHGVWSPQPKKCTPICGEIPVKKQKNPKPNHHNHGHYTQTSVPVIPWHVGIYKATASSYDLECGGSIISERAVLTAAQCFWDRNRSRIYHASLFRVVAGKTSSIYYSEDEDPKAKSQYFEVKKIYTAGGFTEYYDADIAMVVVRGNIKFKSHIAPICLPFGISDEHPVGSVGILPGWSFSSRYGEHNHNLQTIELSVLHKEQCLASTSATFRPFATQHYKFCAVYDNSVTRICHGGAGGGLVFSNAVNGKEKYYLRGVASRGPTYNGNCDSDVYALFVNNVYFHDFFANSDGGWAFQYAIEGRGKIN